MFEFDTGSVQETNRIADYLLTESRERGELLTPLKLQKLIFYSDAWHLALYDQEITPERFQAWVHGPVAVSQYHRFKEFQWRPITADLDRPEFDERTANHLNEIIDVFGSESGTALEIMTHQERPWLQARGGIPDTEPSNAEIDKEVTKLFYRSIAAD